MITAAGPPGIRPVLEALRSGPVAVLVSGGAGTGKTTALAAVRRSLRDGGNHVLSRAPRPGDHPDAAVVVDDAHLLAGPDLQRLTQLAEDSDRTLVVAAELRVHNRDLRTLIEALERRHPTITLRSMGEPDVAATLCCGDRRPAPGIVDAAMAATAGLPFLVAAVATAQPATPDEVPRVVFQALLERVRRLDERTLEALLIVTLSTELGAADVGAALTLSSDVAFALCGDIRGTGLAEHTLSDGLGDAVHLAVAQTLGASRHREVESALLRTQLELSTLSDDLALRLAEHGLHDERLAGVLRDGVRHDPSGHPPSRRIRYLRAAVDCGATDRRAELADALALSGDCAAATALADDLLAAPAAADRAAGVRVAAAVAAHDGNGRQAADLFGWLGPFPDAVVGAAAVIAHIGIGDTAAAAAALAAGHTGPPTAAARAARALADGLTATVRGHYPAAATLGQAAAESAMPLAMPDTATALTTLAALHNGDTARARSLIARAMAGEHPEYRHRLLRGWVRMLDGRLDTAAADAAGPAPHRRDALWAAALSTAIARRSGDAGALQQHWNTAMDILAECAVDLYSLLPLGELWVAAARLRQVERLAPALDQARDLLAALGDPPSWSPVLHWAGLHAGMLANDPTAVAPHGQALAGAAAHSPFAAALAGAGRTWLRVLAGQVDSAEVVAAARALARSGLTSDATRLAGQAALYAADPKASALMLQVARDLTMTGGPGTAPESRAPIRPRAPSAGLSDREREVAELLLLGMPYRDIGARLFISAKTVEHHVARIRRRLGAGSRSEMLSMLRTILNTDVPPKEG